MTTCDPPRAPRRQGVRRARGQPEERHRDAETGPAWGALSDAAQAWVPASSGCDGARMRRRRAWGEARHAPAASTAKAEHVERRGAESAAERVAPRRPAQRERREQALSSVSPVPRVMTMKPQKMRKWYLLPSALTKRRQALAGSVVFSTTFFWREEVDQHGPTRSSACRSRSSGRPAEIIRTKRRRVQANIAEGGGQRARRRARVSLGAPSRTRELAVYIRPWR